MTSSMNMDGWPISIDGTELGVLSTAELSDRISNARSMLNKQESGMVPEPLDLDSWIETQDHLSPTPEPSPSLSELLGHSTLKIMQALLDRTKHISNLQLSPDEKIAILPVRYVGSTDQDITMIDLRRDHSSENVQWTLKLIEPILKEAKGSLWTMGGVRGAIVCAGPTEAKSMYYHAEYSVYKLKYGSYPKPGTTELAQCQERAKQKLQLVDQELEDPDMMVGLQIIYTKNGQLDWIPIVRSC